MKLAIITHPLRNNYGGILQNFALQKVLEDQGHDVFTIDRQPGLRLRTKVLSIGKRAFLKLKGKKVRLVGWPSKNQEAIINQNTRAFVDKYIKLTNEITNNKQIPGICEKYHFEGFVVGSDQVWRRSVERTNDVEFLRFIEGNPRVKKVAFSASFGVADWEYNDEETKKYAGLAQQFDSISVREASGVDLCRKYLNVDAVHLLDPTMLLNKDVYIDLISHYEKKNVAEGEDVFVYVLDRAGEKNKIIEHIERKLGSNSFEVMPLKKFGVGTDGDFEIDNCIFPQVESWIHAFERAKFVITDSFHGTVFSIIFNKPFISIINEKRGAARFYSLLKMFGLENRIVRISEDLNKIDFSEKMDFNQVNAILEKEKVRAFDFLKNSLG